MIIGILGLAVHLLLFASIFDIYFRSPIIQGLASFQPTYEPPAKRLVLFLSDGLRADKLFELQSNGSTNAPYLRDIIINKGCWGISRTHVPTESRPGHVAIIAGFYEDVSAVTKGWKENPVNFDSVFNQSRFTWSWGSPDILPIFSKDTSNKNIFMNMYSPNDEDFAREDPSQLDVWVAVKFEEFLNEAKQNETLMSLLKQDKLIFFLHLLGLDTIGHAKKPGSNEYKASIDLVDKLVEKCVNLVNDYFNDEKSAFIFTSDHGMTDWGSHGAGSLEETQTPIVAWGSGIRLPKGGGKNDYQDGFSEAWRLSSVRRSDVNQADVAPLMASLLGIPIPVNSVGMLPVDYLGTDWQQKSEAMFLNAQQILAQFKAKVKEREESALPMFHKEFRDLSKVKEDQYMEMIEILTKQKRYIDSIQVSERIIQLALKGLNYYQKYDRFKLCFSVVLSFLGWISYVGLLVVEDYTYLLHTTLEDNIRIPSSLTFKTKLKVVSLYLGLLSLVVFLLYVQSSSFMYYCYYILPVFLWMLVSLKSHVLVRIKSYFTETDTWCYAILGAILIILGLQLLVLSFFYRQIYTFILVIISTWPYFNRLKDSHKVLSVSWFVGCIVMAIFPSLPVVGRDSNYNLVTLSGWLCILLTAFSARRQEIGLVRTRREGGRREPFRVVVLTGIQVFTLWLSTYTVKKAAESIANKLGLPLWCQIVSWTVLGTSLVLPFFGSNAVLTRLLNIAASFLSVSILMCVSHEGFFFLGLCLLLFLWLCVEHQLSNVPMPLHDISFGSDWWTQQQGSFGSQKVNTEDLRRSFYFLFFILFAFFGVGNIASVNSFEPSSVYCFLTVFSPFTMGFLLLLKIMIPFLLVSCCFRAILISIKVSTKALFQIVLIFSDFMAMSFFFLVKDSGSWLEIGTSISHYVIMMCTIIFVMGLYGFAWLLTTIQLTLPLFKAKRHVL